MIFYIKRFQTWLIGKCMKNQGENNYQGNYNKGQFNKVQFNAFCVS